MDSTFHNRNCGSKNEENLDHNIRSTHQPTICLDHNIKSTHQPTICLNQNIKSAHQHGNSGFYASALTLWFLIGRTPESQHTIHTSTYKLSRPQHKIHTSRLNLSRRQHKSGTLIRELWIPDITTATVDYNREATRTTT